MIETRSLQSSRRVPQGEHSVELIKDKQKDLRMNSETNFLDEFYCSILVVVVKVKSHGDYNLALRITNYNAWTDDGDAWSERAVGGIREMFYIQLHRSAAEGNLKQMPRK